MKKLALLDYCYPDYFTGYHLPVCAILVYGTMTNGDVADEIESELNATYDYINPDSDPEIDRIYDEYVAELRKEPELIFVDGKEVENEYCAYLYFSIINPVVQNGITFLNP